MAEPIAGVLLAAGMSTRMGRNKLFLPLGASTVLRHAVATATDAGLSPLLCVVGHEAERAIDALRDTAAIAVRNPDYARGQSTSLRAGIAAVPDDAPAAVVMLADMPRVDADMLRALVDAWRDTGAPLVVSRYGDVIAPPIVYGAALFAELRALDPVVDGDRGGKAVVARHRHQAVIVDWPAARLADLDEPGDLAGLDEIRPPER
jgi:molybdenum cofactor cytidylyltransferase